MQFSGAIQFIILWIHWALARILFYPTVAYRNQSEVRGTQKLIRFSGLIMSWIMPSAFHWWNRVDEYVLIGAFPLSWHVKKVSKIFNFNRLICLCWTAVSSWLWLLDQTKLMFILQLFHEETVRAVVNCCEEANGPEEEYRKLGVKELHLSIVGTKRQK